MRRSASGGQTDARLRLGIDIGGTFTDLCLIDPSNGRTVTLKTPTVPNDVARGIADALDRLEENGVSPAQIGYFVHGTTLALNSLLQRTGSRAALLVTEGFRDVLELARLRLPLPFSFYSTRPLPLIPRERVVVVRERARADGSIETELTASEIERAVAAVDALAVEAVAICLLHAYVAPGHEQALESALLASNPARYVCRSSETWPEIREYERSMATAINAYVGPALASYVGRLEEILAERHVTARPYLTRSGGGVMTTQRAGREAVHTLLSGPAAGVVGALTVAGAAGLRNVVTFDMGGTSADAAIIEDGVAERTTDGEIGGFPVVVPTVAITTLGAGGGSIARVDSAGVLEVGPESTGADPGPACYGRGGTLPTVTDAFLLCGLLNPQRFAGRSALDVEAARAAVATIGRVLAMSPEEAANGVIEVVLANTAANLRGALDRRGVDPGDFVLVAFGGAGPLLACLVADEVGLGSVLVPPAPGTLCAFGAVRSDFASDFVQTVNHRLGDGAPSAALDAAMGELIAQGTLWLDAEAPRTVTRFLTGSGDMRYIGQSYQLEVPVSADARPDERWRDARTQFDALHAQRFGQSDPAAPVEIVSLRLRAQAQLPAFALEADHRLSDRAAAPEPAERIAIIHGEQFRARVRERATLATGVTLDEVSIIEQPDTTVLLPPSWRAVVDPTGNLLATRIPPTKGRADGP